MAEPLSVGVVSLKATGMGGLSMRVLPVLCALAVIGVVAAQAQNVRAGA
jgi:hypothetical protein